MYKGIALSASVMCMDWLSVGQQLKELEQLGLDYLHYDVIDGVFAPDFTMGSSVINVIRSNTSIPSDYHLMVDEPGRIQSAFETSSEDFYTIHQESCRNLHRELVRIKNSGARVGVALSPATPLTVLDYIIEDIDLVVIMTVNPGYMGQQLVPQSIQKIYDLRQIIKKLDLSVKISVDGNVNPKTIPQMVAAGADILVLGSSGLFTPGHSINASMRNIEKAIDFGLQNKGKK
jgi:ribulose-phosphate 3-epimerase